MNRMLYLTVACMLIAPVGNVSAQAPAAPSGPAVSHPPLMQHLPIGQRTKDAGRGRFVDAAKGNDNASGDETQPWRTLAHAIRQLQPGDTLYLRGGVYYENARISLHGRADAPITIRAYPDERAVVDGGFREFFESPATAWEPYPAGAEGEYRSTRRYPNLRYVVGSLGDSMIGLNAYYHATDLRATNEMWDWVGDPKAAQGDVKPVYCGPGIWHDPVSGYIHARLAHTHLPGQVVNYRGQTDARKVPLVLADFRSIPLLLDGARHVRVQDLVIRGSGYDAVSIDNSSDIVLDGLTIWAGSYGLRGVGTHRLVVRNSALYGNVPPWTFRGDTSLRTYPGRGQRDITRLNTHALIVADCGREFSVYAFPVNDDWEIANCLITDAHDGAYLGGINLKFHHNLVEGLQDDGLYLSPMYKRYFGQAQVQVYENVIRGCLTALAFGGPELSTDSTLIYRNLFDLREPVLTGRPSSEKPEVNLSYGKVIGDHGSPPWPTMKIYHNTVVAREKSRYGDMALLAEAHAERHRHFFNNILLHGGGLAAHTALPPGLGQEDGNLYWGPANDKLSPGSYFDRYRNSEAFKLSQQSYPPGYSSHSVVADPGFVRFELEGKANDYSLQAASPAVNAGVPLPAEWPDPLREQDQGQPDIGWLPRGAKPPHVGPQMP